MDSPPWYLLFASVVGETALILFVSWILIWVVIAIWRVRQRQKLNGSYRAAWDVALPIGGLICIVVVGRAILAWMIR